MYRLVTFSFAFFLGFLFCSDAIASAKGADNSAETIQYDGEAGRERSAGDGTRVPTIGFIESPSAHCYQPDPLQDVCFVAWQSIYVTASPNYMIKLTIDLDGRRVLNVQGFFQTSMYLDRGVAGPMGFRVQCGPPSVAEPEVGNSYAYVIRARDSADLSSANYGTVACPAFIE